MKLSHLEKLSGLSGVSGDESAVAREIIAKIEGYARWELDPLGNLLVYKEGEARRESPLLLFTPMDEPGLMVTGIEKDGSLKFTRVGETDRRTIPGRRVKVGPDGIPGVVIDIRIVPPASERDKPVEPDKLRIDIGASSEEEAKAFVHLGDTAAFQAEFERLGLHRLKGKALSSRAGCAVLISLIREPLPYDTLFAFTVLREAGEGGSSVVASRLHPGRAVMVAPVPADDIPGGGETFSLGGGPVIRRRNPAGCSIKGWSRRCGRWRRRRKSRPSWRPSPAGAALPASSTGRGRRPDGGRRVPGPLPPKALPRWWTKPTCRRSKNCCSPIWQSPDRRNEGWNTVTTPSC